MYREKIECLEVFSLIVMQVMWDCPREVHVILFAIDIMVNEAMIINWKTCHYFVEFKSTNEKPTLICIYRFWYLL